ncbi:tetratricopeptide repeat protein [Desulfobaculum bizertense]|uniref:Tetratricopeptide repeat-containing protein n=1 Tax=Desulfobaculum bizertense DSM 18034 TaxID=1121442 RepID=A0A1T4W152_9BACT|nr:tetratricopeptide repeat protein [Desulfobaculum bizertense]SKA71014.1 Tetratricopeptide repeat-containing protein [Desulfobaculum bizertense DSM 18034]
MQAKIKWFQEVLELDPASRVFLPLAELYKQNGQLEEAAKTLRSGLEKNPNTFEARMLLVDVLAQLGLHDEAQQEVCAVTNILSRYPSFWTVWAQGCASEQQDVALALQYIAARLSGVDMSWQRVLEQGLSSLLGAPQAQVAPSYKEPETVTPKKVGAADLIQDAAAAMAELESQSSETVPSFAPAESAPVEERGDDGAFVEEAPLTTRTRTMAELLLQQDDYRGALEIFRELYEAAPQGSAEADELAVQIEAIETKHGKTPPKKETEPEPDMPVVPEIEDVPEGAEMPGKQQLVSTLEALADRLEARAEK